MLRSLFSCWGSPGEADNINKGVKDQGSLDLELYTLVNNKGGSLVELMKSNLSNQEIDERILTIVQPYLYNKGEGKEIPITDLIKCRRGKLHDIVQDNGLSVSRKNSRQEIQSTGVQPSNNCCYQKSGSDGQIREFCKTKLTCWDITKRGAVGETILHLCLLYSTQLHSNLAKRLLNVFPILIKDTYLGDMYSGETVLHLAIAINEDPMMVKFLLEKGADVNQRCCGKFFCPLDQKDSQTDCPNHEWFDVSKHTDYAGDVYLGEYPLSFAACLSLEECVRLLHAKGANLRNQDSNGNTVFHMMVIHNNQSMFDLLLDLEHDHSALRILNRQNLTPLTLAAKLARQTMYDHILEKERQHLWTFGDVICAAYPLQHIDSITDDGDINPKSALRMIVYGEEEGHLEMMHGLVVKLLQEKWKTFIRFRFYRRFVIFILYFIASCTAFGLRPGTDYQPIIIQKNVTTNGARELVNTFIINPCYLLQAYTYNDVIRLTFECIMLVSALVYTVLALKELIHQGFYIFFTTLSGTPAKFLFHVSCLCVILMLPGRIACSYEYEDIMSVIAMLCTAPYFLFFCRGFHIIGPFVVMIYKMIKGDLLRFFTIYAIFVIGFSQAIYVCFIRTDLPYESPFKGPIDVIPAMFALSVGQFEDLYTHFHDANLSNLSKFMFIVYMILVTLLLVNMLIAMMGNTYTLINNIQKEWFRQWAKVVLVLEQSVTKDHRKQFRMLYSEPHGIHNTRERVFIIRWQLSEKEKAQNEKKQKELFEKHRLIIQQKSPKKKARPESAGHSQYLPNHTHGYLERPLSNESDTTITDQSNKQPAHLPLGKVSGGKWQF